MVLGMINVIIKIYTNMHAHNKKHINNRYSYSSSVFIEQNYIVSCLN